MQSHSLGKKPHSHMWLVGVVGVMAGFVLMVYVPSLKVVSETLILFAGFHLVGGVVLLSSLYVMVGRRLFPRRSVVHATYDFGWMRAWTLGPLIAAMVSLAVAVAIQVVAPTWWPVSIVLTLLAANSFAGHLIASSTAKPGHAALPMVELLSGNSGLVLDGGCGAGRTSIAIARALPGVKIVALDRFDSDYIEGGGHELLERNLSLAKVADRVRIEQGDLTQLPFNDATFDAAVSAHAIDHLGSAKENGLREMWRILKPGRHFLLVVWVPGWTMFAVANLLSLSLATKASWRSMAIRVGFEILQEGAFNGVWFLLLGKTAEVGAENGG